MAAELSKCPRAKMSASLADDPQAQGDASPQLEGGEAPEVEEVDEQEKTAEDAEEVDEYVAPNKTTTPTKKKHDAPCMAYWDGTSWVSIDFRQIAKSTAFFPSVDIISGAMVTMCGMLVRCYASDFFCLCRYYIWGIVSRYYIWVLLFM